MAKGIRALLDTVMQALPQVGNLVEQIVLFLELNRIDFFLVLFRVFYFFFFSSFLLHLALNYSAN